MKLVNQSNCLNQLDVMAHNNKHSILISGPRGSGKTYLAKQYANLLSISDFQIIEPKVPIIKETINMCYQTNKPVVLCIENLDLGLTVASYTLLKFLEEPLSYVYIVITCRNTKQIPDTIISRSATLNVSPPTDVDLINYGNHINSNALSSINQSSNIWKCVKDLSDVEIVLSLNKGQLEYFKTLNDVVYSSENIASICWKLQNYPNNSEVVGTSKPTPIDLVIKYIMSTTTNPYIWKMGHECLKDISSGRISTNAAISKFLLEIKYGG